MRTLKYPILAILLLVVIVSSYSHLLKQEQLAFIEQTSWFWNRNNEFTIQELEQQNPNFPTHLKQNFVLGSNSYIESIKSYDLTERPPKFNFFLNRTKFEFSWHYSVEFEKIDSVWLVSSCQLGNHP